MAPLGVIFIILFSAFIFVPFFRKMNIETAYHYLEMRFDRGFRYVSSLTFILFHIVRIAIVLYLPTLALVQVLPDVNPIYLVSIVAILCVIYTTIGGIEAVVWTDAIQTIILLVGAFIIIFIGFQGNSNGLFDSFSQLNNNVQEPVANSSRGARGTAGKARTVKLTPSQVAIAKRLGVPLEEYAKHVK